MVAHPRRSFSFPGRCWLTPTREVKVLPIAGGIVTRVHVELGTTVKRSAPLATLFSPELAETQTKYLSMRAMLVADHHNPQRVQQLVALRAVSRPGTWKASHGRCRPGHPTEDEAARQRLLLLGLSRRTLRPSTIPARSCQTSRCRPDSGVMTGRMANLGQVVSMGQELFVVTDLAHVW